MAKKKKIVKAQPTEIVRCTPEKYVVFTDGSCLDNKYGGYSGIVFKEDGMHGVVSGGEKNTTNNRMEMTAVISALKNLPEGSDILVVSDSTLVVNGCSTWINKWRKTGYNVKNPDLWREIDDNMSRHKSVKFKHVYSHREDSPEGNKIADGLAYEEAVLIKNA